MGQRSLKGKKYIDLNENENMKIWDTTNEVLREIYSTKCLHYKRRKLKSLSSYQETRKRRAN